LGNFKVVIIATETITLHAIIPLRFSTAARPADVPDLGTLRKDVGSGSPLAAIAERADIMAHFDRNAIGRGPPVSGGSSPSAMHKATAQ